MDFGGGWVGLFVLCVGVMVCRTSSSHLRRTIGHRTAVHECLPSKSGVKFVKKIVCYIKTKQHHVQEQNSQLQTLIHLSFAFHLLK